MNLNKPGELNDDDDDVRAMANGGEPSSRKCAGAQWVERGFEPKTSQQSEKRAF